MGVRHMQGVAAHLTTLKSDGKRRHPSRCIFAKGKNGSRICTCPQGPLYYKQCKSASRCEFYEEKE